MSDTLLKWIAEELLGFTDLWFLNDGDIAFEDELHGRRHLKSWHGVGLVVEAMKKQPIENRVDFNEDLEEMILPWWNQEEPWLAVFAAARNAVAGTEGR